MKRIIFAAAVLFGAVLSAQAATQIHHGSKKPYHHRVVRDSSDSVIYNKDSPDPAIGWHWESGMRVCHNDCENDEIPGSGFTCKDVTAMGLAMRECTRRN